MRVTIFTHECKISAPVIGEKDLQFIVLKLGDLEIFFEGYDQANVDVIREVIEKLTVAANDLQDNVFRAMPEIPEKLDILLDEHNEDLRQRVLSRTEIHQGQADRGQDTWDEHDEKV